MSGARSWRVGVDTGGTFTDAVAGDGTVAKVLSTPSDPSAGVRRAIEAVAGAGAVDVLAHGTTVATNALLERAGARVALVTNDGFTDIIEIGRQDRPSLYDQWADRPPPLVPRSLRFGIAGRLDARGDELEPVGTPPALPTDVEAVAVCLLHSDLSPLHEQAVAAALRGTGHDVTCSHEVSPEFREYERTVTTVVNAYLRPVCRGYLTRLADLAREVLVLTSAGGLTPVARAADVPAALLLSGPAGGVRAAAEVAEANGFADAVSFDMGGTSTDVCLVRGGVPEPAPGRTVGGFAIRLPSLDVHTIGAGGGSIASLDPGGALVVGPGSAGADPGPACYGRGGLRPTVTDANLVAGRIPADATFAELGRLDVAAARRSLDEAGVTAEGVLRVVNANMERAVRVVSVGRGVDPRMLALVAFGGAGPLHACDIADALGMPAVIVPARAGVFSAVGIAGAPRQHEVVRSWPVPGSVDGLAAALDDVRAAAVEAVTAGAEAGAVPAVATFVDCRYAGQSHELTVGDRDEFHAEHERRNGFARPGAMVEVVALRARAQLAAPMSWRQLPPVARQAVVGPAVVVEEDCTMVVPDGWAASPGEAGALILRRR